MKMQNWRASDPAYKAEGKKGLTSTNKLEPLLWARYEDHPEKLLADALSIQQAIDNVEEFSTLNGNQSEDIEVEEGGILFRIHRQYERNRNIITKKKKAAKGRLQCEACNFDYRATYGEIGADYIEVHHTKPLHLMEKGQKTKLSDLALLCANCHRMVHRKRPHLTIEELKAVLRA